MRTSAVSRTILARTCLDRIFPACPRTGENDASHKETSAPGRGQELSTRQSSPRESPFWRKPSLEDTGEGLRETHVRGIPFCLPLLPSATQIRRCARPPRVLFALHQRS